jgi:phage tail-like protein
VSALPTDAPRAASARRYLRGSLPAVYSEVPDGRALPVMGLLVGLEQVLDPVVVLLDNLTPHLEAATTSAEMVDFLTGLTGAPLDDTLPIAARRALLKAAACIGAARGTRAGLQLALTCALPALEPQVLDNGQVRWGRDAEHMRAAGKRDDRATSPGAGAGAGADAGAGDVPSDASDRAAGASTPVAFEVLVAREPSALERAQIERCIADHLPLGAGYHLGVRDRGAGNS